MKQRKLFRFFAYSFFALQLFTVRLQAQSKLSDSVRDTLIVGVSGTEPFIVKSQETANPKGISVEIWEDLAKKKGWFYSYKIYDNVDEALHALERGSLDLLVGPISITSQRVIHARFSQPYYQSSLAILSRMDEPNLWDRIKPLFSTKLLIAVSMFLFILAIVGTLFWLAERKKSPEQFPSDPLRGIGNGMWLAIVTMSTTGYGDMAPITLRGRIIAGSWMVITFIFATSMIAGIASTLTITGLGSSTVNNIEQLSSRNVATIDGSPAEFFLKEHKTKVIEVTDLAEAMAKLKSKEVEAVVYDRPQLLYYLKYHKGENLYIARAEYYKQGYGFAFPLNSSLVNEINRMLLELAEDREVQRIIDYYLGSEK